MNIGDREREEGVGVGVVGSQGGVDRRGDETERH